MGGTVSKPTDNKLLYDDLDKGTVKNLTLAIISASQGHYNGVLERNCIQKLNLSAEDMNFERFELEPKVVKRFAARHFCTLIPNADFNEVNSAVNGALMSCDSEPQHFHVIGVNGTQLKILYVAVRRNGNHVYFSAIVHTFHTRDADNWQLLNDPNGQDVFVSVLMVRSLRKLYAIIPGAFDNSMSDAMCQMLQISH